MYSITNKIINVISCERNRKQKEIKQIELKTCYKYKMFPEEHVNNEGTEQD